LRRTVGQERFYWREPDSLLVLAGFGKAAELIAWGKNRFQRIEHLAQRLFQHAIIENPTPIASPRLMGGFSFRDDFVPDHTWAVFHPAHFVLPHFLLTQTGSESWLTINSLIPRDESPSSYVPYLWQALASRYAWLVASLPEQSHTTPVCPPPVKLRYPMSRASWQEMIDDAVSCMQAGGLRKVVLARASEVSCGDSIQVDQVLKNLDEQYPGCYRFLFEPQPRHAFLGATPELLVKVAGTELTTMGLAGSIRRGQTPAEDEQLAQEMLNSPKERYEHRLVVEELRRRLKLRTSSLSYSTIPKILKFRNIQHLFTPIQGVLKRPSGVLRLLGSLHPTPALGGSPREAAMEYIRNAEPIPRGWYAAPVGWLTPDLDGEFAVAIRSAVIQERRAWLYAGAGIVAGSQADQEWKETALKFKPVLQALGLEGMGEG
jgi:menaquinone-specific isochorismate synthase